MTVTGIYVLTYFNVRQNSTAVNRVKCQRDPQYDNPPRSLHIDDNSRRRVAVFNYIVITSCYYCLIVGG